MARVALVTNVMSHYRVPCFRRLAERLDNRLTIFLLSRDMEHRRFVLAGSDGGLPVVHLPGRAWTRAPQDDLHLNDPRPVLRLPPELLILGGWDEPTYLMLWAWAVMRRKKVLFWIESTARDARRAGAREAIKRLLLRRAAGCIVPGRRASDYCRQLAMDERRIFVAPNAADREFFGGRAARLVPRRDALRVEAGLDGFTILFAGRLVERYKGVRDLLAACAAAERRGLRLSLLLAGDGPDLDAYRRQASERGLRDVRFLGTLDRDALCRCYAMADVLALPSRSEPWGFVLNEAMEFGLPLVVSDAVGAGPDLALDGENGITVAVGDVASLAAALERLAADAELRASMGESSRRIIERFTPEHWAEGVLSAVGASLGPPDRPAG